MELRIWTIWWIIFCTRYSRLFSGYLKKHREANDNPSKRICVNKTKNRIAFKIKTGHYLKILTPKTMELLGSTEIKITIVENSKNVSHLEITKIVLIHCSIVNDNYQQNSRVM